MEVKWDAYVISCFIAKSGLCGWNELQKQKKVQVLYCEILFEQQRYASLEAGKS